MARICIIGGNGYIGWPLTLDLASRGHCVMCFDSLLKDRITAEVGITSGVPVASFVDRQIAVSSLEYPSEVEFRCGDACSYDEISQLFVEFSPDTIIHLGEQPSAPYSGVSHEAGQLTLINNLSSTFNILYAMVQHCPSAHLIKLGTMGEYGTPNIDIEEGWLDVEHNGRKHKFLFPRQASSLYHTSKIMDTDLIWLFVRQHSLCVTDLMQGPVFGIQTPQTERDPRLSNTFFYDFYFGTVINRFVAQVLAGKPLTIYGSGGQTRGYLSLGDSLKCITRAAETAPPRGQLRVLNQFSETFSVVDLASIVMRGASEVGIACTVEHILNPRIEMEEHYYNPTNLGFRNLGIEFEKFDYLSVAAMLVALAPHKDRIRKESF